MYTNIRSFATVAALVVTTLVSGGASAGDTPAPAGAKVYFIDIKSGDVVTSPFLVRFGLSGMGVAPAGIADAKEAGHHHLLIDTELKGAALNQPIPADAQHRHFGKGQTEASIELPAGQHTLQLVVGDWKHTPHKNPVMSDRIAITVK